MRRLIQSLALLVVTVGVGSCATPGPDGGTVTIDRAYGTLEFKGSVERIDWGRVYEFRPSIEATFRRDGNVNRVREAELDRYFLIATVPGGPGEPSETLYRDDQTIEVRLSRDGETVRLPEVSFRIPRSVVEEAAEVGLAVSDGPIMWSAGTLK